MSTNIRVFTSAIALLLLCVICPVFAADATGLLQTVDAPRSPARLLGIDPAWRLRFEREKRATDVQAGDIVRWGQFVDAASGPQLLLADDSTLVVRSAALDGEHVKVKSDTFGEFQVAVDQVRGIIVSLPSSVLLRDQLADSVRAAKGEQDRLILANGDVVRGTIIELTSEHCQIETGSQKTKLELSRIRAIVFDPGLLQAPRTSGLRVWIGFKDGSRVLARRVQEGAGKLQILAVAKLELDAALDSVIALQPVGGRAIYLSDLPVASYRHVPYLSLSWPFRLDRSVLDTLLRTRGELYLKGIGTHSAARLTYDLDKPYKLLEGQVAIDDSAGTAGSVVMRIFADHGDGAWKPLYSSPAIRGGTTPISVRVDLSGVKRISLLTEFGERADQLDYADWLDLHLVE